MTRHCAGNKDQGRRKNGFGFPKVPTTEFWVVLGAIFFMSFGQMTLANTRTDAGAVKGVIRAVADGQSTVIAGANLTLINKSATDQPIKTVSDAAGNFLFDNLPTGDYLLTVEAAGLASVTREIKLLSGASLSLEINLTATINESVTIREEEGLLSISETATSNVVRAETLKIQPLRTETYQSAIALTPGVVRDGFGNDFLKGTRTGQSGYTVNGVDVTDPGTGKLAFEIPLEAAGSVEVEENPYSAEFGRFTGGVTNLQTKGGGEKFKVSAARFFPTLHNIFSTTVDSFRPRLTFSGALVPKRLYFLQSFEYRYSTFFTPSQPKTANKSVQEGFNAFTQIDWSVNKNNSLKINAAIFPQKIRNVGLDTFNPAATTPNYKQRGILISVSEQSVFANTSFLSSEISYKTFDVDIFAKSNQPFSVAPENNSGGYFADTRRQTKRFQWQETYYSRQFKFFGQHSLKTGFGFDHTKIGGQLRYNSIFIRRSDGTLAQRVDFTSSAPLNYRYSEIAVFVQDRFVVSPKLTLDYGLRFDRDGVTRRNNPAPRFSFLFLPLKNDRTMIRGGIGIFYDRSLSSAGYFDSETIDEAINPTAEFEQVPDRTVTDYAANGTTVIGAPRVFETSIGEPLRTPRSVRWSISLDRGITKSLTVRVGFLERFTKNDLLIDPITGTGNVGKLLLNSRGRSRYDEFQLLLAYNDDKLGNWNASYVFSGARGDLNTADKFLSDTPSFVVRVNEYGRQPFDAPHRFLFYGQINVSQKYNIRIAPLFEIRSGFPFSAVNERLDFVGMRNSAGRFPLYVSLDLQVTKGIKLPFFKDKRARVGVAVFNLMNRFNPRDVQTNLTSPNYGKFYNSLGTSVKAKFDIDF